MKQEHSKRGLLITNLRTELVDKKKLTQIQVLYHHTILMQSCVCSFILCMYPSSCVRLRRPPEATRNKTVIVVSDAVCTLMYVLAMCLIVCPRIALITCVTLGCCLLFSMLHGAVKCALPHRRAMPDAQRQILGKTRTKQTKAKQFKVEFGPNQQGDGLWHMHQPPTTDYGIHPDTGPAHADRHAMPPDNVCKNNYITVGACWFVGDTNAGYCPCSQPVSPRRGVIETLTFLRHC